NLNGKSVDCRYNEKNKQLIYDTRIEATDVLGQALRQLKNPPRVWINAASATIYRHALDRDMDEETGEIGHGFSVDVCRKWEQTFFGAEAPGTRKVALRTAIVLGREGGALQPLKNLAKIGFGGPQGKGNQYFSWLHENDFARIVDYVIENDSLSGVYNAAAPHPLTNREVMKALRKAANRPVGLPMPEWLLHFGAWLINTETELILKSRRVVPGRLLESGFKFQHSTIEEALEAF
ncbi:MAG: TIGR01777 family oxidoreductase, partial [Imperialibacter sp.]